MTEIVTDCIYPDCPNPENHLYINPEKVITTPDGKFVGAFVCYRCDRGGTLARLKKDYKEIYDEEFDLVHDADSKRSWREIDLDQPFGKRVDIDGYDDQKFDGQDVLPDDYQMIGNSEDSYLEKEAVRYLEEERGISKSRARYYQIGYGTDETMGHLIIPVLGESGCVVYWIERKYLFGKRRYNNPPNSEVPVGKSDVVFGLNQIRRGSIIYVAEGVFDAISIGPQAVAIFGKELSSRQQSLILSKDPSKVVMMLDAEDDAKYKSIKIGQQLNPFTRVEWVMLDDGDPDDLSEVEKMDYLDRSGDVSFRDEIDLQLRTQ